MGKFSLSKALAAPCLWAHRGVLSTVRRCIWLLLVAMNPVTRGYGWPTVQEGMESAARTPDHKRREYQQDFSAVEVQLLGFSEVVPACLSQSCWCISRIHVPTPRSYAIFCSSVSRRSWIHSLASGIDSPYSNARTLLLCGDQPYSEPLHLTRADTHRIHGHGIFTYIYHTKSSKCRSK